MHLPCKHLEIITPAKVGSSNFNNVSPRKPGLPPWETIDHNHDLKRLKDKHSLENRENTLIVVGVRNPIDRNLSYLFQTYCDNFNNSVKYKRNNYEGEFCYIPEMHNNISTISPARVIELYFQQKYHTTFNDWFDDFFEITNIIEGSFDKERGYEVYSYPRGNKILIYTLEKLDENENDICDLLGITELVNKNNSKQRNYYQLYTKVKESIVYPREYIDSLLNTPIMKFFYSDVDIEEMRSKYNIV